MELDKTLGRTGLQVSVLGFGGTGLGNMYVAMSEREAIATLHAAYAAGHALLRHRSAVRTRPVRAATGQRLAQLRGSRRQSSPPRSAGD